MLTKKQLQDELQSASGYNRAELDRFAKRFQDSPLEALEWSQDVYKFAARVKLAEMITKHLEKGNDIQEVLDLLEVEAMNGARFPKHSTSPTMNYANQMWIAALAELAAKIRGN